jgi:hypothetical protein
VLKICDVYPSRGAKRESILYLVEWEFKGAISWEPEEEFFADSPNRIVTAKDGYRHYVYIEDEETSVPEQFWFGHFPLECSDAPISVNAWLGYADQYNKQDMLEQQDGEEGKDEQDNDSSQLQPMDISPEKQPAPDRAEQSESSSTVPKRSLFQEDFADGASLKSWLAWGADLRASCQRYFDKQLSDYEKSSKAHEIRQAEAQIHLVFTPALSDHLPTVQKVEVQCFVKWICCPSLNPERKINGRLLGTILSCSLDTWTEDPPWRALLPNLSTNLLRHLKEGGVSVLVAPSKRAKISQKAESQDLTQPNNMTLSDSKEGMFYMMLATDFQKFFVSDQRKNQKYKGNRSAIPGFYVLEWVRVAPTLYKLGHIIVQSQLWRKCVTRVDLVSQSAKQNAQAEQKPYLVGAKFNWAHVEQEGGLYYAQKVWLQLLQEVMASLRILQPRVNLSDVAAGQVPASRASGQKQPLSLYQASLKARSDRGKVGQLASTSVIANNLGAFLALARYLMLPLYEEAATQSQFGHQALAVLTVLEKEVRVQSAAARNSEASMRVVAMTLDLPLILDMFSQLKHVMEASVEPLSFCVEYLFGGLVQGGLEMLKARRAVLFSSGHVLRELQKLLVTTYTFLCGGQRKQVFRDLVLLPLRHNSLLDITKMSSLLVSFVCWFELTSPFLIVSQDKTTKFHSILRIPLPGTLNLVVTLLYQFQEYCCGDLQLPDIPSFQSKKKKGGAKQATEVFAATDPNAGTIFFPVFLEQVFTQRQESTAVQEEPHAISRYPFSLRMMDEKAGLFELMQEMIQYGPLPRTFFHKLVSENGAIDPFLDLTIGRGSALVIPYRTFKQVRVATVTGLDYLLADKPELAKELAAMRRHSSNVADTIYDPNANAVRTDKTLLQWGKCMGLPPSQFPNMASNLVKQLVFDLQKPMQHTVTDVLFYASRRLALSTKAESQADVQGDDEDGNFAEALLQPVDMTSSGPSQLLLPFQKHQDGIEIILAKVKHQFDSLKCLTEHDFATAIASGPIEFPLILSIGPIHCLLQSHCVLLPTCGCCGEQLKKETIFLAQQFDSDTRELTLGSQVFDLPAAAQQEFIQSQESHIGFLSCANAFANCVHFKGTNCYCVKSYVLLLQESRKLMPTRQEDKFERWKAEMIL